MPTAPEHDWPATAALSPVRRIFGDLRFHTDGELSALVFESNDTLWSIEDTGFLRMKGAGSSPLQRALGGLGVEARGVVQRLRRAGLGWVPRLVPSRLKERP